jgi:aspartyl protease family protein
MRSVITFAVVAMAASVVVPRYLQNYASNAPALMAARPDTPAATTAAANPRSVVLSRSSNGHFRAEGRIDGRRMNFMVDTGASVIALTARDAAMIGIHPAETDYVVMVSTANGTVRAAPVQLNMVEIEADIVVHDVQALVMPEGALSDNLLGMSFLSRLHHFEYSDGKLMLEQ